MKNRLVLLLALTIALGLVLTGCKSAPSDLTKGKDAKQIVEESQLKMAEIKSYDMDMDMTMNLGEAMDMTMDISAAYFADPLKMKMLIDMTIKSTELPEDQAMTMEQYVISEDDGLKLYQNAMGQWMKMSVADPAIVENLQMDPVDSVKIFVDNLKSADILGEEKVGEMDTLKITLTTSGDMFKELLAGMNDSLGAGNPGLDMFSEDMFAQIGDLTYTVWVDKATLYMVKGSMDLSEFMKNIGQTLVNTPNLFGTELTNEDLNEITDLFGNASILAEFSMSNFDNAQDFALPEAAAEAMDLGTYPGF